MSRSRASAKQLGARMEKCAAEYLAAELDDRIERRRLTGAKDRGDVSAVRTSWGARVVVEVKDSAGSVKVGPWLNEAEVERVNDSAEVGVVVFKRSGVGYGDPAQQGVLMTLETLVTLLRGQAATNPKETP